MAGVLQVCKLRGHYRSPRSLIRWRAIDVSNLGRMRKGFNFIFSGRVNITDICCVDFPRTQQIFLEENYRSTGSILSACLAIVSQGPQYLLLLRVYINSITGRQVTHR